MSPTRKEKNQLKEDCQKGSTSACADLGQAIAGKPKGDGKGVLTWVRMILFGAFVFSTLLFYILSLFDIVGFDFLWIAAPYLVAFIVLMVKGEQEGPHPIALWIAGIIIPIIFGIFVGFIIFFGTIDWVLFTVFVWYVAVMFAYIIVRFADRADDRAGLKLWILLITVAAGLALFAVGTIFWYLEIFFPLIILFWVLTAFLNGIALFIVTLTLWRGVK